MKYEDTQEILNDWKDTVEFEPVSKPFVKYDNKKIKPSLIPAEYIEGIAAVATFGAEKYTKDNWKLCEDKSRYIDALERHLLAYKKGEIVDNETGLSHLYHIGCNAAFIDWFDRVSK